MLPGTNSAWGRLTTTISPLAYTFPPDEDNSCSSHALTAVFAAVVDSACCKAVVFSSSSLAKRESSSLEEFNSAESLEAASLCEAKSEDIFSMSTGAPSLVTAT